MNKQLNLPRKYKSTDKKFKKFEGKAKFSYSQYTSYKDPKYFNSYVLGYIFGIPQPSNFWAEFGTYCGTSLEYRMEIHKAKDKDKETLEKAFKYFNEKDIETLHKANKIFPPNALYEREIVLDRGSYVVQGFIDVNYDQSENVKEDLYVTNIVDIKTGGKNSRDKGTSFYGSNKYGQTKLYARALEEEGENIGYCGVVFLDRIFETEKTNPGTTSTFENPILHLSGEILEVETPYEKESVDNLLKDMDKVAKEISSLKTTYDKLSKLHITL